MILSEAIDYTFKHRETWATGSGNKACRISSNHCLRILGDIEVTSIKTSHFVQLSKQLLKEGKAKATVNRICAALSTILQELKLNGFEINPPAYKRQKEPKGRTEFYTVEDIENLLKSSATLKDHYLLHDSILFAYKTGCRQAELLGLRSSDINLKTKEITFVDVKTGGDHTVPIHPDLQSVIERRLSALIDEYIFPWRDDKQLRDEFIKVRDSLNLTSDKCWHTIRHSTATHLVTKGASLRIIMSLLNHSNVNTTLRYAKAADTAKQEAIDLL